MRPSEKRHALCRGPIIRGGFLKVDFSHGAVHFKNYMFSSYI